ncbi:MULTISPECIES: hypothetical protein [Acinetobacter calcoaceticus/baumannii complex]|uniref:hypothetical protein n=1 Tax=Acinetobacter calcoaceticus/baumannii complex TaxID=909768 RepID=UPI001C0C52C3|nr:MULTISPECIES: hypothetical protein [Acinetobacter calcoaceticus/baumannii complex]MBU3166889.1 hypothetical protein [Acinetobacter baumannii]MCU4525911.1 hypothetical protein [Acinetobacter pittii]MCU4548421.1 hypothetical protein [Acinetobacter pittii]MCU4559316.1 hypothetical protein [Acinetobacter pittii]
MTLEVCKLCGEEKELQRSHVIGKAVFRKILKEDEVGYAINISIGENRIKKSSDTWDTKLLCRDCEQLFNSKFEDYSYHVLRREQKGILTHEGPHGIYFSKVNTYRVILYFFSIYWRAAYSTHSSYSNVVINDGISNHLKQVFYGKANLNPKAFSIRIRLLKDATGGFPPESLKRIIINPFNRITDKGFILCMIYEGYFFELFCNASSFKERKAPGFLSRARDSFFVPYVDIFDIPEAVNALATGLKIHNETPDEEKIKI